MSGSSYTKSSADWPAKDCTNAVVEVLIVHSVRRRPKPIQYPNYALSLWKELNWICVPNSVDAKIYALTMHYMYYTFMRYQNFNRTNNKELEWRSLRSIIMKRLQYQYIPYLYSYILALSLARSTLSAICTDRSGLVRPNIDAKTSMYMHWTDITHALLMLVATPRFCEQFKAKNPGSDLREWEGNDASAQESISCVLVSDDDRPVPRSNTSAMNGPKRATRWSETPVQTVHLTWGFGD